MALIKIATGETTTETIDSICDDLNSQYFGTRTFGRTTLVRELVLFVLKDSRRKKSFIEWIKKKYLI